MAPFYPVCVGSLLVMLLMVTASGGCPWGWTLSEG